LTELYEAIYNKLRTDSTLTTMISYNASTNANIYPYFSQKKMAFDHACVYGRVLVEPLYTDVGESNEYASFWRVGYITISGLSRDDQMKCSDICERAIRLISGADLSQTEFQCGDSQFDRYTTGLFFDNEQLCYRQDVRFKLTFRDKTST